MPDNTFDADLDHPWAQRYRIPRVQTTHPRWRYEVALRVPDGPEVTLKLDGDVIEPTEEQARIIGCFIDYRRSYYRSHWAARMLERPFDIDDTTNTVILACLSDGWRYRRESHRDGELWPYYNDPRRADYPPTTAGLIALLDHINDHSVWRQWKTDHPDVFTPVAEGLSER